MSTLMIINNIYLYSYAQQTVTSKITLSPDIVIPTTSPEPGNHAPVDKSPNKTPPSSSAPTLNPDYSFFKKLTKSNKGANNTEMKNPNERNFSLKNLDDRFINPSSILIIKKDGRVKNITNTSEFFPP